MASRTGTGNCGDCTEPLGAVGVNTEDTRIKNGLTDKEKCIDEKLTQNGGNFIRNILNQFDGDDSEFDIIIESEDNVYNSNGQEVNGKTIYTPGNSLLILKLITLTQNLIKYYK